MTTITHRALSGSSITLNLPPEIVPRDTATSVAYFEVNGVEFEFTAGPRDLGAAVAASFGISLGESYRMHRGDLLLGSKVESWTAADNGYRFSNNHVMAVWRGAHRSLHSHFYDVATADILALFSRFSIAEVAGEIQMSPIGADVRRGRRPESVMFNLPELGLAIVRKRVGDQDLPGWQGSPVDGGEAYCDKKDAAQPMFMLASDSAVATFHPDADDNAGSVAPALRHQRSIDLVSVIRVGWS